MTTTTLTFLLLLGGGVAFILSGIKNRPGLGILAGLALALITVWRNGWDAGTLGLTPPGSWTRTLLLGFVLGGIIQFLAATLLDPGLERMTETAQDHSTLEGIRENWLAAAGTIAAAWIMGGLMEEIVFRGFWMSQAATIAGTGGWGIAILLLTSAALFGTAHWYQDVSGVLATGTVGLVLGGLFIGSGYNLWLPIFTHGFIDTFGILFMATGVDERLQHLVWGKETRP